MHAKVAILSCLALASCDRGHSGPTQNASPAVAPEEAQTARVENLPPRDEGYALPERLVEASKPVIVVDPQYTGKDREDLIAYAQAAISALSSATTAANAAALDQTYPKVWLNKVTKHESLKSVGKLAEAPRTGFSYLPARLIMETNGTGAYEQKDPNSSTGGRMIGVREYHLQWWRSQNAVRRSCAINTLAHEITHNMTRDPKTFRWAFEDTGPSTASVTTEKGSYTMGALAQCTYLQSIGRIDAAGVAQCVRIWGLKKAFDVTHCDDFNDTELVKWPKDETPRT